MRRAIFGKEAKRRKEAPQSVALYAAGSRVLGNIQRETKGGLEFGLPNGSQGFCKQALFAEALSGARRRAGREKIRMLATFDPHLFVELRVLGGAGGRYECTPFVGRSLHVGAIVSGIVATEEEEGYTVYTGRSETVFVLKSERSLALGSFMLFQVEALTGTVAVLSERIERQMYLGSREELAPGAVLRASVTGVPRHCPGKPAEKFTNRRHRYTAFATGVCSLVAESRKDMDVGDEEDMVLVYVSEDRATVHAVPFEEYLGELDRKVADLLEVGTFVRGEVCKVLDGGSVVEFRGGEGAFPGKGFVSSSHYSDFSTSESKPVFAEGDAFEGRIYHVEEMRYVVTMKKALLQKGLKTGGYQKGDVVKGVVKRVLETKLFLTLFGNNFVYIPRGSAAEEDAPYVGRVYTVLLQKEMEERKGVFLGRRCSEGETLPGPLQEASFEGGAAANDPQEMEGLQEGMEAEGEIYHIYQHGAFIKIGGLRGRIRISEISSRFVKDWQSTVHVGQRVRVIVYDIDRERARFEASIKKYEVLSAAALAGGAGRTEEEGGGELSVPFEAAEKEAEKKELRRKKSEAASEEERSGESSTSCTEGEDEEFEREVFARRNDAAVWIRRMAKLSAKKALELGRRALEEMDFVEEKKKIDTAIVNLACAVGERELSTAQALSCVQEGLQRGGADFLKRAIDNTRASRRRDLVRVLVEKYISERKGESYGYRELMHQLEAQGDVEGVSKVYLGAAESAEMAGEEKKALERLYLETMYRMDKERARTVAEGLIERAGKREKAALFSTYLDLESGSVESRMDVGYTRRLFERAIGRRELGKEWMKSTFKRYLSFEKEFGDKEAERGVIDKAKEYVESACAT